MSKLRNKLANISRSAEEVEGVDRRQEFIDALGGLGYNVVPDQLADGRPILTPYVLLANNETKMQEVATAPSKDAAKDIVLFEVDQLNALAQEYSDFIGGLSSAAYNKLIQKIDKARDTRNMDAQNAIAKIIYDGMLDLEGNKVIQVADLDNEIEKIAKELTAQFEKRVRTLLSSTLKNKH